MRTAPSPESDRTVRARIRQAGQGFAYHFFLSHVRAPDKDLARRLRVRLQRIARRWWELRQMRVYLDVASGPAGPSLTRMIHDGLRASAGLVLLACEQSRDSRWVTEEVRTWWGLEREPPIIVLTGGDIVWDYSADDFDWERTTALNEEVFRGRYGTVPAWIDLRPAERTRRRLTSSAVAIAAALLRIKPEILAGHERRRQRRQWTLAATAGVTVCVLTVVSVWYAAAARQARHDEVIQGRRKVAEQLANAALGPSARLDQSLLLAAAAYQTAPEQQTQALWHLAGIYSGVRRILRMPAGAGVGSVDSVAFSPDGRWLAGAASLAEASRRTAAVVVWPGSGDGTGVVVPVRSNAVAATALAFSADGRTLAVGDSSGSVSLLAVPQDSAWPSEATATFADGPVEVDRLSFAADGARLAVSHADGTTRVWRPGDSRRLASFSGVRSVFDPRGNTIASLDTGSQLVIRDARTLAVKATGHIPGATDLAYREDGRYVAVAAGAGTTGLWLADVATGQPEPMAGTPVSTYAAFSGTGTIATDAGIVTTDPGGGPPAVRMRAAAMMARSVAFAAGQGMYAVAGHWLDPALSGGVILWDAEVTAHRASNVDDEVVASAGRDGVVARVSVATGRPVGPQPGEGVAAPAELVESRDRTLLAGVNGHQVSVWKQADGTARTMFLQASGGPAVAGGRGAAAGIGFSPDNRRLAVARPDGQVAVLSLSGASLAVETVLAPQGIPADLAFSPDGQLLAVATASGIRMWQVPAQASPWQPIRFTPPHPGDLTGASAIVFTGARSLIVADGERLVRWEPADGRVNPLPGPAGEYNSIVRLAVNPRHTLLAGLTTGGLIPVWSLESGRRLETRLIAPVPVRSMTFTEDGSTLIASGAAVAAWNLDPRKVVEWICDVVRRGFDAHEWRQFGPGEPPDVCPMWSAR